LGFRVGVQVQQTCLNPCLCQLLPHVQQDGTCCPPISRWAMRALLFLCPQPAQRTSDIAGLGNSWVGLKFVDRVTACCGCCSCKSTYALLPGVDIHFGSSNRHCVHIHRSHIGHTCQGVGTSVFGSCMLSCVSSMCFDPVSYLFFSSLGRMWRDACVDTECASSQSIHPLPAHAWKSWVSQHICLMSLLLQAHVFCCSCFRLFVFVSVQPCCACYVLSAA
jgi:hypothetical protein